MTSELAWLAVGAAMGGLVQGTAGFGFAMVAVSIWVWSIDPRLAAVMAVFGGMTGQIMLTFRVWRGWHVHLLWPFVLGSAIGIPFGQRLLTVLDANRFKLVLGGMLVACCSAMLVAPRLPKVTHGGKTADAAAGLLGGLMAPISGFSGLAPALWATLRGYTKDEHRAVLQNFNLIVLSTTFLTNVWTGRVRSEHVPMMAVVAGALILPAIYGSKIYTGMSPAAFRSAVLWILVFAGLTMLASALRAMF